jgi:hypothetical protein
VKEFLLFWLVLVVAGVGCDLRDAIRDNTAAIRDATEACK